MFRTKELVESLNDLDNWTLEYEAPFVSDFHTGWNAVYGRDNIKPPERWYKLNEVIAKHRLGFTIRQGLLVSISSDEVDNKEMVVLELTKEEWLRKGVVEASEEYNYVKSSFLRTNIDLEKIYSKLLTDLPKCIRVNRDSDFLNTLIEESNIPLYDFLKEAKGDINLDLCHEVELKFLFGKPILRRSYDNLDGHNYANIYTFNIANRFGKNKRLHDLVIYKTPGFIDIELYDACIGDGEVDQYGLDKSALVKKKSWTVQHLIELGEKVDANVIWRILTDEGNYPSNLGFYGFDWDNETGAIIDSGDDWWYKGNK